MNSHSSNTEVNTHSILANSEANFAKKIAARYLFPKNADKSVRRHKRMGTPLVRKAIMGTFGYPVRRVMNSIGNKAITNYTMDARKGRMERAAEYATKQSVFNEVVHIVAVVAGLPNLIAELHSGSIDHPTATKFWFGVNLGATAVQRYNRARIVQFIDKRFEHGKRFDDEYTNWLHLDNRSINHFIAQGNESDLTVLHEVATENSTLASQQLASDTVHHPSGI